MPDDLYAQPAAFAWPTFCSRIENLPGHGASMHMNLWTRGLTGYIKVNTLGELHRLALLIEMWDAEEEAKQRREALNQALGKEDRDHATQP